MNYHKYITLQLLALAVVSFLPFVGHAADYVPTIQLPPSPLPQIHSMLKQRDAAQEQIKIIQLKSRTLITEAQIKLERSRSGATSSDSKLQDAWQNGASSLDDLNSASQKYHDNKDNSQIAMETMREVFRQSEASIAVINQQIMHIEQKVETIRASWANKHAAEVLDVARQTEQTVQKIQARFGKWVAIAQEKINKTQQALAEATNRLHTTTASATKETQQTLSWVSEQQEIAKQAQIKSGGSWHIENGSYSDMQENLNWAKVTKNRAKLAISQAKVVGGLVEAEVAIAQARVESLQARLREDVGALGVIQTKSNRELGRYAQKQELIQTLTSLVRGPVQYKN
jgi:hypothetical protein